MAEDHAGAQPVSAAWLHFARRVVELTARDEAAVATEPAPAETPPHSGVFVTLHKSGQLRGCMGTLDAARPLAEAVREAAICAAAHDPRFRPVSAEELPDIRIELSVLSAPEPMHELADLVLGQHGIIVRRGGQRGLFLPQVAPEHHLDKETFLARCCVEKAGLPANAWRDPHTEVLLFTTTVLQET